jgi:hypothetical protein
MNITRTVRRFAIASLLSVTACAGNPAPTASGNSTIDFIRSGETRAGRLTASDRQLSGGYHFQDWIYEGRAGERVIIDLRSSDFDAYLELHNAARNQEIARNDDGGSGTDARIEATLPEAGRYLIRARSYRAGATGSYALSVVPGRAPVATTTTSGVRVIAVGETRNGRLTTSSEQLGDNSYYDRWYFDGRAGERIRIDMRSTDFDSFLSFGTERNGRFESLATDDDGGDGLNARIDFTIPNTGRYLIRANSLRANRTGNYSLSVTRR